VQLGLGPFDDEAGIEARLTRRGGEGRFPALAASFAIKTIRRSK